MSTEGNATAAGGGMGALGFLGCCFVVLKLLDKIDWSWWWVLAPFWAIPAILVLIFLVWLIVIICRQFKRKS